MKSVEYSEQRRQTAQRTHAGEHGDELHLAPAAELKVVVQRRHLEKALRAGLHCAPFAHKTVGTLPDGTVRLSVSAFNRESEIDTFLSSLRAIAAGQAKN